MRKKFAKNFTLLLIANLLVKPIWIFGIDRKVQLMVGAEVYGAYFTAANFSFLLSILLDLGINNFTNRSVARSPERAASFLHNLLKVKIWLSLAYFVLTVAIAFILGVKNQILLLLAILAINQILLSFILHFRAYIAALHFFKKDTFVSILDKLLAIVIMLSLWFIFSSKPALTQIVGFASSQTIALFITAVIAYFMVKKLATTPIRAWSKKYMKTILLHSIPFAFLVLQMTIYGRVDAILLNYLLPDSPEETGIYAAGFRLLDAATQFGFLVATLLLPMFSKALKQKQSVKPLVGLSFGLVMLASCVVAIVSFWFRESIISMLYHTQDIRYQWVLVYLMAAFIPIASVYVFGTLLTANGNLKRLNIIAGVGIIVNVLVNFLLIPTYGAVGAAASALITQSIVAVLHIVVSIDLLKRKNIET